VCHGEERWRIYGLYCMIWFVLMIAVRFVICCSHGLLTENYSLLSESCLSSIKERLQIDTFILVTGHRSSYFTVEIIHGGCFVGNGSRRSYVSGHSVWYDNVDSVTWSPLMIENLV
jgi:hypothetical protein